MQDVDAVDLVDLFDAVLEVEGRRVVDGHLELGECAEDLHLQRDVRVRVIHCLDCPAALIPPINGKRFNTLFLGRGSRSESFTSK